MPNKSVNNLTNYQKADKSRKLKRQLKFDLNNNNDELQKDLNVSNSPNSALKNRIHH